MLDLGVVLSLALRCAPGVAPETMAAIAYAESGFDARAIGVNGGGPALERPRDRAQAARIARRAMADGANLDLGLAQINSRNLAWLGLTVEEAFDPCRNLAAAATVLRAAYRPRADDDAQTTLRRALSRYNSGDPERGFANGYVDRVEAASRRLGLINPNPADPDIDALRPPPPQPPRWDVFGRAQDSGSRLVFQDFRSSTP